MRCYTLCLAQRIDISALERHCRTLQLPTQKYWDVLQIEFVQDARLCHVFANGCVVIWNCPRAKLSLITEFVHAFCLNPLPKKLVEGFMYLYGDQTTIRPHDYFNVEVLTIEENDPELKLSLAYGFSQSIKLREAELRIEGLIEKYRPMVTALAQNGRMSVSRLQVQKIIGEILEAKSQINLNASFCYQPKFFWKYANLESYYLMLERYLDITIRIEALNQQLDALNEIFHLFNSYLENEHSHFLEMIIIVLITIEIIVSFFNVHL